jgi:rhodanese-related sulfurtransferase
VALALNLGLCIIPCSIQQGHTMQDILTFMQHHSDLSIALIVVFILLLVIEFIKQKQGGKSLTPHQVTHLINHENAVVVDLRTQDLYTSGHIPGSILIPFKELNEKFKKIEKLNAQPIVLVCANGIESQRAYIQLTKKGMKPSLLRGGLRAWRDANMPLVKGQ